MRPLFDPRARKAQGDACISVLIRLGRPITFQRVLSEFPIGKKGGLCFADIPGPRFAAMCRQLAIYGTECLDYEPNEDYLRTLYGLPPLQR